MLLLALDTATAAVTVAAHDGTHVVAERSVVNIRRHAEILTPTINDVMTQAGRAPRELTAVAVGVGPGPFTGLRVGLATAVTLGLALDIPVYGVCSLDAIAEGIRRTGGPDRFAVATDARRKEVYWAGYVVEGDRIRRQHGLPRVDKPADLPPEVLAGPVAGAGPRLYPEHFAVGLDVEQVSAADLATFAVRELGAGSGLLPVQPLYLRQPDATPATAQKSVLP